MAVEEGEGGGLEPDHAVEQAETVQDELGGLLAGGLDGGR